MSHNIRRYFENSWIHLSREVEKAGTLTLRSKHGDTATCRWKSPSGRRYAIHSIKACVQRGDAELVSRNMEAIVLRWPE